MYMNTTSQLEEAMNTSILNYPGFQSLPKGIKQMLVASEAHFFDQLASHGKGHQAAAREMTDNCGFKVLLPEFAERASTLTHSGALFGTFARQF